MHDNVMATCKATPLILPRPLSSLADLLQPEKDLLSRIPLRYVCHWAFQFFPIYFGDGPLLALAPQSAIRDEGPTAESN